MTLSNGLKSVFTRLIETVLTPLVWAVMLAVVLALGLWSGLPQLQALLTAQPAATAEVRSLIISGLKDLTELTTVQVSTKATVVTQQPRKLLGMKVGDTHLVYEGVGTVRAGIDLKHLEVKDIRWGDRSIHILLPPPYITDTSLDVNRSSILAHYRRWLGTSTELDLQEQAQAKALQTIRAEACESNALEIANQNAKQLIETILQKGGYQAVVVETQLPASDACQH